MEEQIDNKNINQMNNRKDIKESKYDNILTIPEKCRRCRSNPTEIMCKECYPFIYFCLNCNTNLHSMQSKQNHKVIHLNDINFFEIIDKCENNTNENILNEKFNNINIDKINLSENIKYYIDDIKSLYEKEKNTFMKKLSYLNKTLEKTRSNYIKEINDLNEKISRLEINKNKEMKLMEQKKEYEFKNIINMKDSKINYLMLQNEELNKYIEDLLSQISENNKIIKDINLSKLNNDQIIQSQKTQIELLTKEKNNINNLYTEKIEKIKKMYNEEKKEMIKAYEEQIIKMNNDYIQNKDKIKNILLQREKEMDDINNNYRDELNILRNEIEKNKYKNQNVNNDFVELNNIIKRQQSEIEELKYQLSIKDKEYINESENQKLLNNQLKEYKSLIEKLTDENEYLNKIIYGKSKK